MCTTVFSTGHPQDLPLDATVYRGVPWEPVTPMGRPTGPLVVSRYPATVGFHGNAWDFSMGHPTGSHEIARCSAALGSPGNPVVLPRNFPLDPKFHHVPLLWALEGTRGVPMGRPTGPAIFSGVFTGRVILVGRGGSMFTDPALEA